LSILAKSTYCAPGVTLIPLGVKPSLWKRRQRNAIVRGADSNREDFKKYSGESTLAWASVADSAYTRGTFVYQNNGYQWGGDESRWTRWAWETHYGVDVAFKAFLS
jgi:hypothetical protein